MNWNVRVRDVMSRQPVCVDIGDPPSRLSEVLAEQSFHHIPVLKNGALVGIVSTLDVARLSLGAWVADAKTETAWMDAQFTMEDAMTWEPKCVQDSDTLKLAADALATGEFHGLPVLDDDGALVGMLTSTDLLRWMITA